MDYKHIKDLLERYWQCETSVEEEAELRRYFRRRDVPQELRRYRDWFAFLDMPELTEKAVVKARRITLRERLAPLLKAVAMVAVMLSLGALARHTLVDGGGGMAAPDSLGQRVTMPATAFTVEDVDGHATERLDSLERMEPQEKSMKR